jgi:hypothetical protein
MMTKAIYYFSYSFDRNNINRTIIIPYLYNAYNEIQGEFNIYIRLFSFSKSLKLPKKDIFLPLAIRIFYRVYKAEVFVGWYYLKKSISTKV